MSGICKAKGRRKGRNSAKRNVQNQRTFNNVQERRQKYAKNHRMSLQEFLSLFNVKHWLTKPSSGQRSIIS